MKIMRRRGKDRPRRAMKRAERQARDLRHRDEASLEGFVASLVRFELNQAALGNTPLGLRCDDGTGACGPAGASRAGGTVLLALSDLLDELARPAATCFIEPAGAWRRFWRELLGGIRQATPGVVLIAGQAVMAGFPPIVVAALGGAALLIATAKAALVAIRGLSQDSHGIVELVADYQLLVEAQQVLRGSVSAWLDSMSTQLETSLHDDADDSCSRGDPWRPAEVPVPV